MEIILRYVELFETNNAFCEFHYLYPTVRLLFRLELFRSVYWFFRWSAGTWAEHNISISEIIVTTFLKYDSLEPKL